MIERFFMVHGARVRPTTRPKVFEVHHLEGAAAIRLGSIERVAKGQFRWCDERAFEGAAGGKVGTAETWGKAVQGLREHAEAIAKG